MITAISLFVQVAVIAIAFAIGLDAMDKGHALNTFISGIVAGIYIGAVLKKLDSVFRQ